MPWVRVLCPAIGRPARWDGTALMLLAWGLVQRLHTRGDAMLAIEAGLTVGSISELSEKVFRLDS